MCRGHGKGGVGVVPGCQAADYPGPGYCGVADGYYVLELCFKDTGELLALVLLEESLRGSSS